MDETRTPSADADASPRQYRAQERVEVQREAELAAAHAPEMPTVQLKAEQQWEDAHSYADTSERLGRTRNQVADEMDDARRPMADPTSQYPSEQRWGDTHTEQEIAPVETDDSYTFAGSMPASAFAAGNDLRAAQVPLRPLFDRRATSMYFRANERLERAQAAAREMSQPPDMHPVFPLDSHMEAARRSSEGGDQSLERPIDAHSKDVPHAPTLGDSRDARRRSAQRETGDETRMHAAHASMDNEFRPSASYLPPLFFDAAVVEAQPVESRRTSKPVKHTPMRTVRWSRSEEHPAVAFEFGRTEVPPRPEVVGSRGVQRNTPLEVSRDETCAMPHQRNNEGAPESVTSSAPEERSESLPSERQEEETAHEPLRSDANVIAGAGDEPAYERQRTFDGPGRSIESGDTTEDNGRRFIEQRMRIVARRRAEQRQQTTEAERRASADRRSGPPGENLLAASPHSTDVTEDADHYSALEDSLHSEQGHAQNGNAESSSLHSLDQPSDQSHLQGHMQALSQPLFMDDPVHEDLEFMRPSSDEDALSTSVEDATTAPETADSPETAEAPEIAEAPLPVQLLEVTSCAQSEPMLAPEMTSDRHPSSAPQPNTPPQTQDGVADHWFARKALRSSGPQLHPATPRQASFMAATPCLTVVALSGGVGKTSLVATVGRVLSSVGESVLLADTTSFGLLPYYFGAREQRPKVVRTFNPPQGSTDAPVYLVNYDTDRLNGDESRQVALADELMRHGRDKSRMLLDVTGSSAWLATLLTHYQSNLLIPVAPDMNAVFSIDYVDRFFSTVHASEGDAVAPCYVLNQFDASLSLHMEVREVLRKQLGDRLLPMTIRRSPAVAEALAEGMTVIDYAPESPVAEDYRQLAEWVRTRSAPAIAVQRSSIRWSER